MMYALVDVNSCFVSCEMIFRPADRHRPGIVLSNGDGCIIAANKKAKELQGFQMYSPAFQIEDVLNRNNVIRFSPNFELYVDMSRRFITELGYFTDKIEVYSIDEAFMDLDFAIINYDAYGHTIRKAIAKNLDLPVGIGIAQTKTLCKVASRIAKKFIDRTQGVHVIDTEELRVKALKWLQIGDVWGIGHQHAKKLISNGVHNAYQFTELPDSWVRKNMSVVGLRLKHELQGISCLDLEEVQEPKQEIGTAKSFGSLLSDYELIKEATCNYTSYCAEKLRRQHSLAMAIVVHVETNPYREQDRQYYNRTIIRLPIASNDTSLLIKHACIGLDRIFKQGYKYKKVGVSLVGLVPDNVIQTNLFIEPNKKNEKAQRVVDIINLKYSQGTMKNASCGFDDKSWRNKCELRSPRYTTRLNEIMVIGK